MKLYAYLSRNNIRVADFSRQLGLQSQSSLYRYMRGERFPRKDILEAIRKLTDGQVGHMDFLASYQIFHMRRGDRL